MTPDEKTEFGKGGITTFSTLTERIPARIDAQMNWASDKSHFSVKVNFVP